MLINGVCEHVRISAVVCPLWLSANERLLLCRKMWLGQGNVQRYVTQLFCSCVAKCVVSAKVSSARRNRSRGEKPKSKKHVVHRRTYKTLLFGNDNLLVRVNVKVSFVETLWRFPAEASLLAKLIHSLETSTETQQQNDVCGLHLCNWLFPRSCELLTSAKKVWDKVF